MCYQWAIAIYPSKDSQLNFVSSTSNQNKWNYYVLLEMF